MSDDNLEMLKMKISAFKANRVHIRETFPQEIKTEIQNFCGQGYSVSKISSELGLSYDSVSQWVGKTAKSKKFKELKIKTAANVDKVGAFHISVLKHDIEIKFSSLTISQLQQVMQVL